MQRFTNKKNDQCAEFLLFQKVSSCNYIQSGTTLQQEKNKMKLNIAFNTLIPNPSICSKVFLFYGTK